MEKFLHPDKPFAVKMMAVAITIQVFDYFVPYLGIFSIIAMFLAIKPFINPNNVHFTRSKKHLVKLAVCYVIMRICELVDYFMTGNANVVYVADLFYFISMGLTTIYLSYMSHYFTEGVHLDAKVSKSNVTRQNLNTAWVLFGVLIMASFIARVYFKSPIPSIVGMLAGISGIFFSSCLISAGKIVYEKESK